jgi:hypothetical protein
MLDIDFSRRLFNGLENTALRGKGTGSLSSVLAGSTCEQYMHNSARDKQNKAQTSHDKEISVATRRYPLGWP